jgi:preprotein translocase subunit SecA
MRKRLLQFDDVLNHQRQIVYGLRNRTLHEEDTRANLMSVVSEEIEDRLKTAYPDLDATADRAGAEAFVAWFVTTFPIRLSVDELMPLNHDLAAAYATKKVAELQKSRETTESAEMLHYLERHLLLRSIDRNWQNHLTEMEELRRAVNLRGYAQKDPLNEYKTEAYKEFVILMRQLRTDVCSSLFRTASSMEALEAILRTAQGQAIATGPAEPGTPEDQPAEAAPESVQQKQEPFRRNEAKIGRNAVVRIRKGAETLDLKWKKAEAMVRDEGWVVVETLSE